MKRLQIYLNENENEFKMLRGAIEKLICKPKEFYVTFMTGNNPTNIVLNGENIDCKNKKIFSLLKQIYK